MKEGAFGMSTGTDPNYVPGPFASREETVRMLKVVARYNGIFASHTRNYDMVKGVPDRMGGYQDMLEDPGDKAWLEAVLEGLPLWAEYPDGAIFGN